MPHHHHHQVQKGRSSKSHISVNLNQANVGSGLAALAHSPRARLTIKTVYIHASLTCYRRSTDVDSALSPLSRIPRALWKVTSAYAKASSTSHGSASRGFCTQREKETMAIMEAFKTIAKFPNLTSVTIDLNFVAELPIAALTDLVKGKSQLKSLNLTRTRLVAGTHHGTSEELSMLKVGLYCQKHLQTLRLDSCRGNPLIMQSLLRDLPCVTRIEVSNTDISPCTSSTGNFSDNLETPVYRSDCNSSPCSLAMLLQSCPDLKSLSLVNLPLGQISDAHIQAMAEELTNGKSRLTLTDLTIISSLLEEQSGKAISNMLLVNEAIESLTLRIDWEYSGTVVAAMLRANSKLQKLDFKVYGDENSVTNSVLEIARALAGHCPGRQENSTIPSCSSLRKLRLRSEFDPNRLPDTIMNAFEQALDTNEKLGKLVLAGPLDIRPLPVALRTKLRLNRLRIHDLLRSANNGDGIAGTLNVHKALVDAVISSKDDIHVVYNLLSNYPLFFVTPVHPP